ncbi:hypothetical protein MPLB_1870055 [Mesorhizobium sp. ORS 3324]|nr:hypothetical protein MPLB_1870055 [Mesorhizobium sp. ORS 3324]
MLSQMPSRRWLGRAMTEAAEPEAMPPEHLPRTAISVLLPWIGTAWKETGNRPRAK